MCNFLSFLGNWEKTEKDFIIFIAYGKAWSGFHPGSLQSLSLDPYFSLCSWFLSGQQRWQWVRSSQAPCFNPGHPKSSRHELPRWMLENFGLRQKWNMNLFRLQFSSHRNPCTCWHVGEQESFWMLPATSFPTGSPATGAIGERRRSLYIGDAGRVRRKFWQYQLVEYNTAYLAIFNPNCLCLNFKKFLLWIC